MEYVGFDRDTYQYFKNIKDSRRVHMLNRVQLKEEAIYPDGIITTGIEAYMRYGKESQPVFKRLGGSIIWRGDMLIGLIGPADEKWDICFIAEYPTTSATKITAILRSISVFMVYFTSSVNNELNKLKCKH